jgi:hypothetical protein
MFIAASQANATITKPRVVLGFVYRIRRLSVASEIGYE